MTIPDNCDKINNTEMFPAAPLLITAEIENYSIIFTIALPQS